jgi:antitoxin MazE
MKSESIKTSIIKIGNSQGVRLPKALLALSGIEQDVDLAVEDGAIIIRPAKKPRKGWTEQFEKMAASGDDTPIDEFIPTEWDEGEWEWQ